jgi:hypothetical protein
MYRQGLGDCFLVSFFTGPKPVHMLIDCGTLGAKTTGVKMPDVIADISTTTEAHLNLLIATHEHRDHVSGFGGDPSPFDAFQVDRVWVAWTEDPTDLLAKKISKYKGDLRAAVALVADALTKTAEGNAEEMDAVATTTSGIRALLGFFGDLPAEGELIGATLAKGVDEQMRYVTERAGKNVSFRVPGEEVIEPDWLPGVRFYVLGPPRDESALRNMGEHGSPELYSLQSQMATELAAFSQFALSGDNRSDYRASLLDSDQQDFDKHLPFDPRFRIESCDKKDCESLFPAYYRKEDEWRRIDNDWMSGGSELALQLDSYTNNTSLVLAIELIEDGRVLLFPADAQLGNWESWHEYNFTVKDAHGKEKTVNAAQLLARTVFYKVGHHSSHNATVKKNGLELMQSPDLVAMIPVDNKVAMKKTPPWIMPAVALYKRLIEKTNGRVVRSDTDWPEDKWKPSTVSKADWAKARQTSGVTVTDLFIDYELQ